ncbi:hypothetical protein RI367_008046 [Sorochytrium milnesiophthora]
MDDFLGLAGKHVLVTGASGSVGCATAQQLLSAGCSVTLHYNSTASTLSTLLSAYPERTHAAQCNMTDESQVAALIDSATKALGPVHVLVANHGIWPEDDVPVRDMDLHQWRNTLAVNLDGVFLVTKHWLKSVDAEQKRLGVMLDNVAVVVVTSTAGKFGEADHADYACSKAALAYGFVPSLKNEIVRINPRARVNAVAPGWIRTPMAARAMEDKELLYRAMATSPLKKVSEPEDIARAIVFLASEKAAGNITGVALDVNAGMEGRLLHQRDAI